MEIHFRGLPYKMLVVVASHNPVKKTALRQAFAWMAIRHCSVTLPLPDAVRDPVSDSLELGTANERVFSEVNSKQKGGAFGRLSNGRITRESVYPQTISITLIPFVYKSFSAMAKPNG